MKEVAYYLRQADASIRCGHIDTAQRALRFALRHARANYSGSTRNRACGAHIVCAIVALGGKVPASHPSDCVVQ